MSLIRQELQSEQQVHHLILVNHPLLQVQVHLALLLQNMELELVLQTVVIVRDLNYMLQVILKILVTLMLLVFVVHLTSMVMVITLLTQMQQQLDGLVLKILRVLDKLVYSMQHLVRLMKHEQVLVLRFLNITLIWVLLELVELTFMFVTRQFLQGRQKLLTLVLVQH